MVAAPAVNLSDPDAFFEAPPHAFLEELRILKSWGKDWEASVFIKQQMEGAKRSLGLVGIEIVPLWKVVYTRQRTLVAEPLHGDDDSAVPAFDPSGKAAPAG